MARPIPALVLCLVVVPMLLACDGGQDDDAPYAMDYETEERIDLSGGTFVATLPLRDVPGPVEPVNFCGEPVCVVSHQFSEKAAFRAPGTGVLLCDGPRTIVFQTEEWRLRFGSLGGWAIQDCQGGAGEPGTGGGRSLEEGDAVPLAGWWSIAAFDANGEPMPAAATEDGRLYVDFPYP